MATIDPEQEKRRLAEFYATQMDGELERVASQSGELTEVAREALGAELAKRALQRENAADAGATIEPADESEAPEDEPQQRKLVTIRQFRDLPEALLAQGCLESAEIDTVLVDENMVRTDWLWSNAVGGVKLQVDAANVAAANAILDQPIPEGFEVEGVGDYTQPSCPKCGSLDINFQELDPTAYLTLAVKVPIPFHRRGWRCHSCRAE